MTASAATAVQVETSPKRVRIYLSGELVADTREALLVWEIPVLSRVLRPRRRRPR